MTSICLIIPPSGFLMDERVFPSLGVLKVAAALVHDDVTVCDLSARAVDAKYIPNADVYGITATTPQMPAARRIVRSLRARLPKARVILGGPHATMVNAAAKRGNTRALAMREELTGTFDTVVAGDGEYAMSEALAHGAALVDADDTHSPLFLRDSDTVRPARHLLNLDSYHYEIDGHRATSLIAQLGCPFGCGFCGGRNSPSFRRIRTRSTASIVAEVEQIHRDYGYTGFMFYDDELNVSKALPDLLRALIALQRRLGVRFALRGFVKSELLTDQHAALMHEAGFRTLLVGFESGSPRILANIQKRATVEQNTACVERLRGYGLNVKALMSIGHPGESPQTLGDTREWLMRVRPDEFDVTIITVYPGTPYFDEAVEETPGIWTYRAPKTGDAIHARPFSQFDDTLYYKGVPGSYESFVHTDALSESDLVSAREAIDADLRDWLGTVAVPSLSPYEHSMGQH